MLRIAGEDFFIDSWNDSKADSADSIYAYNAIEGRV